MISNGHHPVCAVKRRASHLQAQIRYAQSEKGREANARYDRSEKGRARRRRHNQTPWRIMTKQVHDFTRTRLR